MKVLQARVHKQPKKLLTKEFKKNLEVNLENLQAMIAENNILPINNKGILQLRKKGLVDEGWCKLFLRNGG